MGGLLGRADVFAGIAVIERAMKGIAAGFGAKRSLKRGSGSIFNRVRLRLKSNLGDHVGIRDDHRRALSDLVAHRQIVDEDQIALQALSVGDVIGLEVRSKNRRSIAHGRRFILEAYYSWGQRQQKLHIPIGKRQLAHLLCRERLLHARFFRVERLCLGVHYYVRGARAGRNQGDVHAARLVWRHCNGGRCVFESCLRRYHCVVARRHCVEAVKASRIRRLFQIDACACVVQRNGDLGNHRAGLIDYRALHIAAELREAREPYAKQGSERKPSE